MNTDSQDKAECAHEWKKTSSELLYRNAGKGGGPDITTGWARTYVCQKCGWRKETTQEYGEKSCELFPPDGPRGGPEK